MKTALAFVCSLLLLWTPFVQTGVAGASVVSSAPTCCECSGSRCCSADTPRPESQPVSATPALALVHSPLLAPASTALVWTLPAAELCAFSPSSSALFTAPATALYARDCALLI